MVGDNGGTRIVLVVLSDDIFLKAFWEYCSIG